jgi:hypothetical protein
VTSDGSSGSSGCVASGGTSSAAGASAEGAYAGTLTKRPGDHLQMLVLENGEFFALYGTRTSSRFDVSGFLQGSGVSDRGRYASSNVRDLGFSPALTGAVNATFDDGARTMAGSVTTSADTVCFSAGPTAEILYDYNAPASLPMVSGVWSLLEVRVRDAITLVVSSDGTFTGINTSRCAFSGVMTPRPSGKNVFDVALTFNSRECIPAGLSASGIALVYPLATGGTQFLLAANSTDRSFGIGAFGVR